MHNKCQTRIQKHIQLVHQQKDEINKKSIIFSNYFLNCTKRNKKIFIAGNGGSASDAQHLNTELQIRYKKKRRPFPSIALTADTALITACSNDLSFDQIFSRQIESLGKKGDIFLGISTSGNSKNIVEAFRLAKKRGLFTLGILGNKGGLCKQYCKNTFIVDSSQTSLVQELHLIFYHQICENLEALY